MDGNHLILHSPVGFVVAFGAGIISFLSPCVLPLVPAYLSMMSGVSSAELATAARPDQRRVLRATLLFVAGFTVVFAALEATASGLGQALHSHEQLLNQIAGVVIIGAGLLFAGPGPARLAHAGAALARGPVPARRVGRTPHGHGVRVRVDTLHRAGARRGAQSGQRHPHPGPGRGHAGGLLPRVWACRSCWPGWPLAASPGCWPSPGPICALINVVSGLLLATLGVLLLTDNLHVLSTWFSDLLSALGLGRLSTV